MIFYITFGQSSPFRNGWVVIKASNEVEARMAAYNVIGKWSCIYTPDNFKPEYFPTGKLGVTVDIT